MIRLNIRVPEEVAQFIDEAAAEVAQRRQYAPRQQPPKGEVVAMLVRDSKLFRQWRASK